MFSLDLLGHSLQLWTTKPKRQKRVLPLKSHPLYQFLSDFDKTGAVVNMSDTVIIIC